MRRQVKDEVMLDELFEGFMKAKQGEQRVHDAGAIREPHSLYLKPRFGSLRAGAPQPYPPDQRLQRLVRKRPRRTAVSGRTVRHVHELLRNILRWGVRKELLTRNVAALIEDDDLPKTVRPKPVALTESNFESS